MDDILRKRGGKERLKYLTHVSCSQSARAPISTHLKPRFHYSSMSAVCCLLICFKAKRSVSLSYASQGCVDGRHDDYWAEFSITMQSWLISLFMDCPPNMGFICPSDTAKKVRVRLDSQCACENDVSALISQQPCSGTSGSCDDWWQDCTRFALQDHIGLACAVKPSVQAHPLQDCARLMGRVLDCPDW